MCKNCVQHVCVAGRVLWKAATYTHFCIQSAHKKMLHTAQAAAFTDITHRAKLLVKQVYSFCVSTLSTYPIVTTIYIYNKNIMGGQKELV